jgi:hypothetical protein
MTETKVGDLFVKMAVIAMTTELDPKNQATG